MQKDRGKDRKIRNRVKEVKLSRDKAILGNEGFKIGTTDFIEKRNNINDNNRVCHERNRILFFSII